MPRIVLKGGSHEPLPPHEQSLLNTIVFRQLCNAEVFSLLSKVDKLQREAALQEALKWCLVHDLVADDEQG